MVGIKSMCPSRQLFHNFNWSLSKASSTPVGTDFEAVMNTMFCTSAKVSHLCSCLTAVSLHWHVPKGMCAWAGQLPWVHTDLFHVMEMPENVKQI